MRKQELVHLHGLLAEVADYHESNADVAIELEEYRSLEIRPTSINRSKAAHQEAVFALADALTAGLYEAADQPERVSVTVE